DLLALRRLTRNVAVDFDSVACRWRRPATRFRQRALRRAPTSHLRGQDRCAFRFQNEKAETFLSMHRTRCQHNFELCRWSASVVDDLAGNVVDHDESLEI